MNYYRGYFKWENGSFKVVMCDCCKRRNADIPLNIPNPLNESTQTFNLCKECQYYILNVVEKAVKTGIKPKFE